ncbi:MAG: mandelate racemase/muconate lactonizing enzyme family protein [Oligoflexales bacterium]
MFNNRLERRDFLTGAALTGAMGLLGGRARKAEAAGANSLNPSLEELDRAAGAPVLKLDGLSSPVIIESIKLMSIGDDSFVLVRSTDGAEGIGFTNGGYGGRVKYLDKILKQLVAPYFIGKDARDLENLLWGVYRENDNYKLQGLALWCPQAWVEFAILDMLGRIAGKPISELIGGTRRNDVGIYVASGRRDTTPEQEIEHLQGLLEKSQAKALKFRIGGRMNKNEDAMPGRTKALIPLVRKSFGDEMAIQADSNSSYDAEHAIPVGRMLEDINAMFYEEPCEFDDFVGTKAVTDALKIPVALGEQESSHWRFRYVIANRVADIIQPDLFYYGGLIRSVRVARMARLANMPTTAHISGGAGFIYMLHFAAAVEDPGPFQEYKLGMEKWGALFNPIIEVKNGKMNVPTGPGFGLKDPEGFAKNAKEV